MTHGGGTKREYGRGGVGGGGRGRVWGGRVDGGETGYSSYWHAKFKLYKLRGKPKIETDPAGT